MAHVHRWLIGAAVVLALAAALVLLTAGAEDSQAANGIIYVDADALGTPHDGSTWFYAFTDLQQALDAAVAPAEIWVAAGTYTPTAQHGGTGDRYRSFQMENGVAIYGGFDPSVGDVAWEDRDWVSNVTTLSGEIGASGSDDNAYHVFYHPQGTDLDGTAILDGFTITGGNANGDNPHNHGGGMYNRSSSPALANCTFDGNTASWWGGGMHNYFSSPALTNCTFAGNSAILGGGMYNDLSSPTLTNCTFPGNSAASSGGGMYNWNSSSPVLTNCDFTENSVAGSGGGMLNIFSSSPVLTNCTFTGNSAATSGGGMYNGFSSSPVLTNCTFTGNSAGAGGGMYNANESLPVLTNCILWGNTSDEIANFNSAPVVTYSDIQGGCGSVPGNDCGDGNIDDDPLFVDAAGGDVHLGLGSPCIDAGTNAAPDLPSHDFEGNDRILDGDADGTTIVDMGVDEVSLLFVDADATSGAGDGTSWEDAYTDLQDALAGAVTGNVIWVAEGTYKPAWQSDAGDPRSATFQMANGVAIYGGFDPTVDDDTWEERDWVANPTILSGDIGDEDVPSDKAYHVFYHPAGTNLDSTAILDGFTITGGNANDTWPHSDGGGMFNDGSSPALANCTFEGNSASNGGGMHNGNGSDPLLINVTFSGNAATTDGGGMHNYPSSSPELTNCTFSDNTANGEGGGMSNGDSSPTLTNVTFSGNTALGLGGAMYNWESDPTLTNCILWGNTGDEISNTGGSTPVVTYSDIQAGTVYPGTGNINDDPLFVDAAGGDVHLQPGSPCIDVGNNAALNLPDHDFEGDARIVDGDGDGEPRVDMGVDEVRVRAYLPLVLRAY